MRGRQGQAREVDRGILQRLLNAKEAGVRLVAVPVYAVWLFDEHALAAVLQACRRVHADTESQLIRSGASTGERLLIVCGLMAVGSRIDPIFGASPRHILPSLMTMRGRLAQVEAYIFLVLYTSSNEHTTQQALHTLPLLLLLAPHAVDSLGDLFALPKPKFQVAHLVALN